MTDNAKTIKDKCSDCGSERVMRSQGCKMCQDCGWSEC